MEFNYIKQRYIERLITRQDKNSLQQYSMHCVTNAWHNIDFCDSERGIHGATLAEVLHCIQHGLLEYVIKSFFAQMKNLYRTTKNLYHCHHQHPSIIHLMNLFHLSHPMILQKIQCFVHYLFSLC